LCLDIGELAVPLAVIYIVAAIGSLAEGALPPILAQRGNLARARNRLITGFALVAAATMPLADVTSGILLVVGAVLAAHQCYRI
jgi:hypothetical protein